MEENYTGISHTFNVKRIYYSKERFGKSTDKEREKEREGSTCDDLY